MAAPPSSSQLFPREHGAYVQLCLALLCGLILGRGHARAWSQALLTFALFLASEPALRLLGRRKGTAPASRARSLLLLLGLLALLFAVQAWQGAGLIQARALIAPGVLAALLAGLAFARLDHTTLGELVAAWALSSSAYPVAILGGAGVREATALTLTLAAVQTLGTTMVRAFLESLKRGGKPWLRAIPLALGSTLAALGWATGHPVQALALVPGSALAAWLLARPPSPRHMKRLGWLLTAAAAAGMLPMLLARV